MHGKETLAIQEGKQYPNEKSWDPVKGSVVRIKGLTGATQYNGMKGVVTTKNDKQTRRCAIKI